ncbi:riboflavin biosynthesis protein RibF [bacterium]|nr:riboflavin biosynthesis protein RibF [bacterium]
MKVFRGLPRLSDKGRVITLGVFDGVHLGHAKIIQTCTRIAKRLGLPAAVITFADHPHTTLAPHRRPPRLATPEQCLNRMQQLQLDEVFLVKFTQRLAQTEAEMFVRRVLVKRLQTRQVVVGQDFIFGKGGKGNIALIRRIGREVGFGVTMIKPLKQGGTIISSSGLRSMVAQGKVAQAHRRLGWSYALHGIITKGDGRGTQIGLPTANLRTNHEIVPAPGTYVVEAYLENMAWPALCHIGKRPTFHKWGPETIEIHIPGWAGNLYHKQMIVGFLSRLREERHFKNAQALVRQVKKDCKKAQSIWTKYHKRTTITDFK